MTWPEKWVFRGDKSHCIASTFICDHDDIKCQRASWVLLVLRYLLRMCAAENLCMVIFEIESTQPTLIEKHEELRTRLAFLQRSSYDICKLTEKSVRMQAWSREPSPRLLIGDRLLKLRRQIISLLKVSCNDIVVGYGRQTIICFLYSVGRSHKGRRPKTMHPRALLATEKKFDDVKLFIY